MKFPTESLTAHIQDEISEGFPAILDLGKAR